MFMYIQFTVYYWDFKDVFLLIVDKNCWANTYYLYESRD